MKRTKIFACALALGLALAGCTALCFGAASIPGNTSDAATTAQQSTQEPLVLFDTDSIKITLNGLKTIVEDKPAGTAYTFTKTLTIRTSTPTLEERQARALGRVSADTDTIKIVVSGDLIAVTDKTAHLNYYIH